MATVERLHDFKHFIVKVNIIFAAFSNLGEGNFGCVRKARANGIIPGDDVRNIVAVKTLKGQYI